ncbi:MAG: restriction endonuclease subunit S [Chloroflexi bacterium]|nr:restriction endonuclease subunit S [Chloroflexota bacterium]
MTMNGNEKRPLPDGWKWTNLESVIENHDGRRVPVRKSDRAEMQGQFPYYGASGIIDHVDNFLFDGDFLLLAEDGANLFSRSTPIAFQAHRKFWVNNHAHVMQTKNGMPLSYLEHYLNSIDLTSFITGTAQPKLTQRNMNKIPVPLAPLAEQERIVAEVERRMSVVAATEQAITTNLARAERLRQSILGRAFSGQLV